MSIFLFIKQFVDLLYQYQWLDYAMVLLVIAMILYQNALVRPNLKKEIALPDILLFIYMLFMTVNLLRSGTGLEGYVKVLSAFLLYFMGRCYYDRILECGGALTKASYIIIYLNLGYRIWQEGIHYLGNRQANGAFYYYDTDMAFAMILAMIFITMFGKNTIFKLVTIGFVGPSMVIASDAGIQVILWLAVVVVWILYVAELVHCSESLSAKLLIVYVVGLLGMVMIIHMPLWYHGEVTILKQLDGALLNLTNMASRYADWTEILARSKQAGIMGILFGTSMGAEIPIQSMYIKIYYATGILGGILLLSFLFVVLHYVGTIKDRKTFYLMICMLVLFLGSGVTVNSLESTQMSWFPMLFMGMVVSSGHIIHTEK